MCLGWPIPKRSVTAPRPAARDPQLLHRLRGHQRLLAWPPRHSPPQGHGTRLHLAEPAHLGWSLSSPFPQASSAPTRKADCFRHLRHHAGGGEPAGAPCSTWSRARRPPRPEPPPSGGRPRGAGPSYSSRSACSGRPRWRYRADADRAQVVVDHISPRPSVASESPRHPCAILPTGQGAAMSKPVGPYTPAVRAGDWIIVFGQLGVVDGALVDGARGPDRQAVANSRGSWPGGRPPDRRREDVCFLQDMDDFATFNEAYVEGFGDHRPAVHDRGGRAADGGLGRDRGLGLSAQPAPGCGRCHRDRRHPVGLPDPRRHRAFLIAAVLGGLLNATTRTVRWHRARRAQPVAARSCITETSHRGAHPGSAPLRGRADAARPAPARRAPVASRADSDGRSHDHRPGSVASRRAGVRGRAGPGMHLGCTTPASSPSCPPPPPRRRSCSTSSSGRRRSTPAAGWRVPARSSPRTRHWAGWPTSPGCRPRPAGCSCRGARRGTSVA